MRRIVSTAMVAACVWVVPGAPAGAATAEETAVAAEVNALRADLGLQALELHRELERKAQDWAAHLAAAGTLAHSKLSDGITADWVSLAENVAAEPTVDEAMTQLVAHSTHYANIVNPGMTHIGVGAAAGGGDVYLVQVFMQLRPAEAPIAETAPAAPEPSAGSLPVSGPVTPSPEPEAPSAAPVTSPDDTAGEAAAPPPEGPSGSVGTAPAGLSPAPSGAPAASPSNPASGAAPPAALVVSVGPEVSLPDERIAPSGGGWPLALLAAGGVAVAVRRLRPGRS